MGEKIAEIKENEGVFGLILKENLLYPKENGAQ